MDYKSFILDKLIDLIITILGVGLGAFGALLGINYQINKQAGQEQKKNNEITSKLVDRCRKELWNNSLTIKNKLIPTFQLTQQPHDKHYEWILAITDSFEYAAYDELLKLNLSHNMPKRIEASLSTSFKMLKGLHYHIKEALAGYKYQNVYGGTPDFRESNYKYIITYTNTISERLEWFLKETNEFTEK